MFSSHSVDCTLDATLSCCRRDSAHGTSIGLASFVSHLHRGANCDISCLSRPSAIAFASSYAMVDCVELVAGHWSAAREEQKTQLLKES